MKKSFYAVSEDDGKLIGVISLDKWNDWSTLKEKAKIALEEHFDEEVKSVKQQASFPDFRSLNFDLIVAMEGYETTVKVSETWVY